MTNLSLDEVEDLLAIVSLVIEEQIALAPENSNIFSTFFIKTNTYNFFQNFMQPHPILSESAVFRSILKSKNLYNIYQSATKNFIAECEDHIDDIKTNINRESSKSNEGRFTYDHPVQLVSFDLNSILANCKKAYLKKNETSKTATKEIIFKAYELSVALFFASRIGTPKTARAIRNYFQSHGLTPQEMKAILEDSEIHYKLIDENKNHPLSQVEKKNIILMAIQVAYIDQRTLTLEEACTIDKYKKKYFEENDEINLFKNFLYLSDPAYFKYNNAFSEVSKSEILSFLLNCLSLDLDVTRTEKSKYLEIIKRFGITLTPEVTSKITEISKAYKNEPETFNQALLKQSYPQRIYSIINCADLLYIDGTITPEDEQYIAKTLSTIFINNATQEDLLIAFMIYSNFLITNFENNAANPILIQIEKYLLKKIDPTANLYKILHLILLHNHSNENITPAKLERLRTIVFSRKENKYHLDTCKEYEILYPKESQEIIKNNKVSFPLEVFSRLVLQPQKCLELDSYKDMIVNLTLAHIELTINHKEFNHQLKNLINNVTFELKIKTPSVEIKKRVIEIACELAMSDNVLVTSEQRLIDKYTKGLCLNEVESYNLTSRILLYSELPMFIHDYLNYVEYKSR